MRCRKMGKMLIPIGFCGALCMHLLRETKTLQFDLREHANALYCAISKDATHFHVTSCNLQQIKNFLEIDIVSVK